MAYRTAALTICTLAALTLSLSSCAYTVPESPEPVLLNNEDGQYNRWNGIGQMFIGDARYCTASLLDTRGASNITTGPAYVLTNGHCASINSGTIADAPYKGQIQFNYFHDTLESAKRYDINKVNWASLASADVAIMELTTSLETLLKDGITPLKLAPEAPTRPGPVHVIGAPGVASGMRLSTCTQEPSNTTLVKYLNIHTDYQKHDCKGISPGSSGSAVLDAVTGELTGVLSGTTYGISPDDLCFWHALCGNNKTKSILPDQASHSFPVDYLSYCFSSGLFNIDADLCTLKPQFNFKTDGNNEVALRKKPVNPDDKTPTWDVPFSMNTPFYRFKTVRDAQVCYSPHHYSGTISTAGGRVDAEIGREEGLYYLCLLGVESAEQRPSAGLRRNTQILAARLIESDSISLPELKLTTEVIENYLYTMFREKSDRNIWTQVYWGSIGETNCADIAPEKYQRIDSGMFTGLDYLPRTLCSYTMDRNLNTSEVRTDLMQRP